MLLVGALGAGAFVIEKQRLAIATLTERIGANDAVLQEVLGEVTRIRVEQRAETQGAHGLLQKLRTYSPMLTSAHVPEPDYRFARAEMEAILRAFKATGEDAWPALTARLREVKGDKDFDEIKWLLKAAVAVDAKAGKEIVKDVVAGTRLPAPRLRLEAARQLIEIDRPLAQTMLRRILTTESSRGVNVDRAMAQGGAPLPDPAALSASGFPNFVTLYVESEDPEIDDTLLMVIGRAEHDVATVQECVKTLGKRHCAKAVDAIEKLFNNPPNNVMNPLFLNHCLTALHEIRGDAARPFIEAALKAAPSDVVANHCKTLLAKA